jgi:hypothetical protein
LAKLQVKLTVHQLWRKGPDIRYYLWHVAVCTVAVHLRPLILLVRFAVLKGRPQILILAP